MEKLNRYQSIVYTIGLLLMPIGIGMYVFDVSPRIASIIYFIGADAFAVMQTLQKYHGTSLTIHRLCSMLTLASVLFVLSGVMLIENAWLIAYPLFTGSVDTYNFYAQYIHNNWVVLLLIAVMMEAYAIHRLSTELSKEEEQ